MIQKSYEESEYGKLYLVPTPIGNFDDMTFRSVETLKTVDIIYCEDTRVTKVLLSHFSIDTPLKSYHIFNENSRCEEILNNYKILVIKREGEDIEELLNKFYKYRDNIVVSDVVPYNISSTVG